MLVLCTFKYKSWIGNMITHSWISVNIYEISFVCGFVLIPFHNIDYPKTSALLYNDIRSCPMHCIKTSNKCFKRSPIWKWNISVQHFFCGWIILWKVIQKNQVIFHEEVLKFRCELTYCNGYSSFNGYISDVKNNWKYICP